MAFLGILMHLLKTNIPPACQECCMCEVCSSLGQKWGNERAITGIKIILTCSLQYLLINHKKYYFEWLFSCTIFKEASSIVLVCKEDAHSH